MNTELIHLLTKYDTVVNGGIRYLCIPLIEVLNNNIHIEDSSCDIDINTVELPRIIIIPDEIKVLYDDHVKLAQDIHDYLYIAANCWTYRNGSFQKSILKKITGEHPALNDIVFKRYGFQSDEYLTKLIIDNKWFIEDCWESQSGLKKL